MSFIPKPGEFCILTERKLKKVNTASFPKNLAFVLIEPNRDEANLFIGNFLDRLERENKIFKWTIGNEDKPLANLENRLRKINPDGIIIPGEDYPSPLSQKIVQISIKIMKILAQEKGSEKIGIRYFSPIFDILPDQIYYFFTEQGMEVKQRAMSAHYSQIERTPFDKVAKSSNRINAILAEGLIETKENSNRQKWQYAEKYYISKVDKKGNFNPYQSKTQGLFEDDRGLAVERFFGKRPIRTLFASPHPDDDVIASGGILRWLIKIAEQRKNGSTLNSLVFTTAHRTKIPSSILAKKGYLTRKEWVVYKENETRRALKQLGGNQLKTKIQFLRLPFYDTMKEEKPDIRVISAKEKEIVYRKFKEISPNLAIIPHPDDLHPDHRATWQLSSRALARIAREERKPIVVLYYLSPWSIKANSFYYYCPIEQEIEDRISEIVDLSGEVMAIVGSELCAGFGKKPPSCKQLGGERAEALFAYNIRG